MYGITIVHCSGSTTVSLYDNDCNLRETAVSESVVIDVGRYAASAVVGSFGDSGISQGRVLKGETLRSGVSSEPLTESPRTRRGGVR